VLNHDVRAGLRHARSFIGLYRRQLDADGPAGDGADPALLDTGLRALANADRSMEDIVRYHRLDVDLLVMGPLPLAEITVGAARSATEQLDQLARAGHRDLAGGLAVQGPGRTGPLAVTGNEALLEWLVAELVVNARKFAGGATVVSVSGVETDGWVTVRVANTGTPIDPELAAEAFGLGRVLEGRGERPGVGLGLSLARRVAVRHAGRLEFVHDPEAGGTTVEFELPAGVLPAVWPLSLGRPEAGVAHGNREARSGRR
jgi:signal transduction histidine kinase